MKTVKSQMAALLIGIFLGSSASATKEVGNGGDAVVKDGRISLLDLVETTDELLDVQRFASDTREVSIKMNRILRTFHANPHAMAWILTSKSLENIQDEGIIATPIEGELKQVAVQKDGVVLIQKNLFEAMDEHNQKALFLHEVLIRTALLIGYDLETNLGTSPLRKIIAFIMQSGSFPEEYLRNILNQLPIKSDSPLALGFNILLDIKSKTEFTLVNPRHYLEKEKKWVRFQTQSEHSNHLIYTFDDSIAEEICKGIFARVTTEKVAVGELVFSKKDKYQKSELVEAEPGANVISKIICK